MIVVASMKKDSLRVTEDIQRPQYHLELEISEFIKGSNATRTLEVCLPWGLTPVVGGYVSNQFYARDFRRLLGTNYAEGAVNVFDTRSDNRFMFAPSGDIRE